MTRKWCFGLVGAVLVLGVLPRAASAESVGFRFVTDQAEYTVAPSGTVDVRVFLEESYTPTADPSDDPRAGSALFEEGLFSAGLRLVAAPGAQGSVLTAGDVTPNAGFTDVFAQTGSPEPSLYALIGIFDAPVVSFAADAATERVLLGTFRFTAGASGGVTSGFSVVDFAAGDEVNTLTGAGRELDALIAPGAFRITTLGGTPGENPGGGPNIVPLPPAVVGGAGLVALTWLRRLRCGC